MAFNTALGKAQFQSFLKLANWDLETAHQGIVDTRINEYNIANHLGERARMEAQGRFFPWGEVGVQDSKMGWDESRSLRQQYETGSQPRPDIEGVRMVNGGGMSGGVASGGGLFPYQRMLPVNAQPSFSLVQKALEEKRDTLEANDLFAEANDGAITESELEAIQNSRIKVDDTLRGITAKLSLRRRAESVRGPAGEDVMIQSELRDAGGEQRQLNIVGDLQSVYKELLTYGYGYSRADVEKIRVYLEEEPGLVELYGGMPQGQEISNLAKDILVRIVKPMLSVDFSGTLEEKKLKMEPIATSFYKTIQPGETGRDPGSDPEIPVQNAEPLIAEWETMERIRMEIERLDELPAHAKTEGVKRDYKQLLADWKKRAEKLFMSIIASQTQGTMSKQDIRKAGENFRPISVEQQWKTLNNAIEELRLFVEGPEMYDHGENPRIEDPELAQAVLGEDPDEPLRMPARPVSPIVPPYRPAGEEESKEEVPAPPSMTSEEREEAEAQMRRAMETSRRRRGEASASSTSGDGRYRGRGKGGKLTPAKVKAFVKRVLRKF